MLRLLYFEVCIRQRSSLGQQAEKVTHIIIIWVCLSISGRELGLAARDVEMRLLLCATAKLVYSVTQQYNRQYWCINQPALKCEIQDDLSFVPLRFSLLYTNPCYAVMLFFCYAVMLLCCFAVMLLCCYAVMLLYCYAVILLWCYVVMLLCYFASFTDTEKYCSSDCSNFATKIQT